MPSERLPTSLFQMKNPGAKAWPSISAVNGSIRNRMISCRRHIPAPPFASAERSPLGRLKSGELGEHVQDVGVVESRSYAVDRADDLAQCKLQRLIAGREVSPKTRQAVSASAVDGFATDFRELQSCVKLQSFIW